MLTNVEPVENLRSLARLKKQSYEAKTVTYSLAQDAVSKGWAIHRKNKKSVRLRRQKPHDVYFLDRIWSLLHQMNFTHLSDVNGAELTQRLSKNDGRKTSLDIVGVDNELAISIKCQSAEELCRWTNFKEELSTFASIRQQFANSVNTQFQLGYKRKVILAIFVSNTILSEEDRQEAEKAKVLLFSEEDIDYYERLISHLGTAAKYQFFADMLPGEKVPGLEIRVPAVRARIGGTYCYTFSISPEYLLKISYVSHRAKGKASDIHTYQRMLSKYRLRSIRKYISEDGIFPTNIVINLEKKRLQFEQVHQKTDSRDRRQGSGVLGWLDIRPAYKSAWIIDGQHRLFAYSGHELAPRSLLSVLAFEGLPASKQAKLFIDINAKQKSVKRSLLQELHAELHWDAETPEIRAGAIISKAILALDADPESALHQRIQKADAQRDSTRCITLTSIYTAIEGNRFHIAEKKHGHVAKFGPLWAGSNDKTLKRTAFIFKNWFNTIRMGANDWWDKGSGEGGGLAMNDGIVTCVNVLGSVFHHLDNTENNLIDLDDNILFNLIREVAELVGEYFGSLSEEERKNFRSMRGKQGQAQRTRRCQKWLHERLPSFNPPGLEKFLEVEKAETNKKAKEIIDRIEKTLQKLVLGALRQKFGKDESGWWMSGVPKNTRHKVSQKYEEDDGRRGGKEYYFDLIHYKKVAIENWEIFSSILDYSGKGNKQNRTSWIDKVNDKRNIVSHASSGILLTVEQLRQLEEYERWLRQQVEGNSDFEDIFTS